MQTDSRPPAPAESERPVSETILIRAPQQARSRRTLEGFLEASRQLLEEEGEGGVTVAEVVSRAGVSVGAFYARFEGRDDLIRYLGERSLEEALEEWSAEHLSGLKTLRGALVRLAESLLGGAPRTLVLLDGHQDPPPSRLRRYEDRVARALRLFDPFPSPPREGDLLRALFLVAGIRELSTRALEGKHDLPSVPKNPETLALVALSMLPVPSGEAAELDEWEGLGEDGADDPVAISHGPEERPLDQEKASGEEEPDRPDHAAASDEEPKPDWKEALGGVEESDEEEPDGEQPDEKDASREPEEPSEVDLFDVWG